MRVYIDKPRHNDSICNVDDTALALRELTNSPYLCAIDHNITSGDVLRDVH